MAVPVECPVCGVPLAPAAPSCANCGAKIPVPTEADLVRELEDLSTDAVGGELAALEEAADAATRATDAAVGELVAVEAEAVETEARLEAEVAGIAAEAPAPEPAEPAEANLDDFVRRVEASVAERARANLVVPGRSGVGPAVLAAGGLLTATGLFFVPAAILLGSFTALTGVALVAIGAGVYFAPRRAA